MLHCMHPREATSPERQMKSIIKLALKFLSLVAEHQLDDLQEEWRALSWAKELLYSVLSLEVPKLWHDPKTVLDGYGQQKCWVLSHFMCGLLELPHSSARVERVFSQLNFIQTKQTNSQKNRSVAGRLPAEQAITLQNSVCYTWNSPTCVVKDVKNGECYKKMHKCIVKAAHSNIFFWLLSVKMTCKIFLFIFFKGKKEGPEHTITQTRILSALMHFKKYLQ